MVHYLNIDVLIQKISNREEIIFPAGIMHHWSLKHVQDVEVDVGNLHHCLKKFHFIIRVLSLLAFIFRVEAVENRRSSILVQWVYFGIIVQKKFTNFRWRIEISGVPNQMMKRIFFVHIFEIRFRPLFKNILNLFQSIMAMILNDLN